MVCGMMGRSFSEYSGQKEIYVSVRRKNEVCGTRRVDDRGRDEVALISQFSLTRMFEYAVTLYKSCDWNAIVPGPIFRPGVS